MAEALRATTQSHFERAHSSGSTPLSPAQECARSTGQHWAWQFLVSTALLTPRTRTMAGMAGTRCQLSDANCASPETCSRKRLRIASADRLDQRPLPLLNEPAPEAVVAGPCPMMGIRSKFASDANWISTRLGHFCHQRAWRNARRLFFLGRQPPLARHACSCSTLFRHRKTLRRPLSSFQPEDLSEALTSSTPASCAAAVAWAMSRSCHPSRVRH